MNKKVDSELLSLSKIITNSKLDKYASSEIPESKQKKVSNLINNTNIKEVVRDIRG